MDARIEAETRTYLQRKMEDMLHELDEVTEGQHPLWDKGFSDVMAEMVLQTIKAGLLGEKFCS